MSERVTEEVDKQTGQDDVQDVGNEEIEGLFFRVFLKVLPEEIIATHEFHPEFSEILTEEDQEKVSEIMKQPIQEILDVIKRRVRND